MTTALDEIPPELLRRELHDFIAEWMGEDVAEELMTDRTDAEIRAEVLRHGGPAVVVTNHDTHRSA